MAAFDLDIIHKYSKDANLLRATLAECERLLWELEYLANEPQQKGNPNITNRMNLVKAQKLLCERLMIGEKIDSLAILIKHYAEIFRNLHVE
jgi:hypothetical protein